MPALQVVLTGKSSVDPSEALSTSIITLYGMAKEVGLHVQRIFQSAGAVNVAVCLLPLPVNVWNVVHLSACVGVGVIAACVGAWVGWLVACTVATLVVGDVDCAPGTCAA